MGGRRLGREGVGLVCKRGELIECFGACSGLVGRWDNVHLALGLDGDSPWLSSGGRLESILAKDTSVLAYSGLWG